MTLQQTYPEDSQARLYLKGWCWINDRINSTHYLFYGADVRIEGLDLFETVLDAIGALGYQVDGFFHAQGEDMVNNYVYRVTNDKWRVEETSALVDWSVEDSED